MKQKNDLKKAKKEVKLIIDKHLLKNGNVLLWISGQKEDNIENVLILSGGSVLLLKSIMHIDVLLDTVRKDLRTLSFGDLVKKYKFEGYESIYYDLIPELKKGNYPKFLENNTENYVLSMSNHLSGVSKDCLLKIKEKCEKVIKEIECKEETKVYLFHELSSLFPLIEGEQFDALVESIRKYGQIEEGVLFDGKILDGRNRYRACEILKIPFRCKEYSGKMPPMDYIIQKNLHGKYLNTAQRAEIGMLLYEEVEKQVLEEATKKRVQKVRKKGTEKGSTAEIVASKVRMSASTLTKVKKIKEVAMIDKSIAKQWEDVKKGKSSIDALYKKIKLKENN